VFSADTFYGIAYAGGPLGTGTVFAVKSNGTGFTNLHNFSGPTDGANPTDLVISSNVLYGAANGVGYANNGTIFSIHTDGTGFENLYAFSYLHSITLPPSGQVGNSDGANPVSIAISPDNIIFGAARAGGESGENVGTVFALDTSGAGFTTLLGFTVIAAPGSSNPGEPPNGIILAAGQLYGTTDGGGVELGGGVYTINTNGTGFALLHNFLWDFLTFTNAPGSNTNTAGDDPANLLSSGNALYGTTQVGGNPGAGSVFTLNLDGTGFKTLHVFQRDSTNDGANPAGRMTLLGNTLYGTTSNGGPLDRGTIFQINTDGSDYAVVYTFSGTNDGYHPVNEMTLVGNTLYGVTTAGGTGGNGTIFSFSLPPSLTINTSGTKLVLSWPTNLTGYAVQSSTNLNSSVWESVPVTPGITNGEYLLIFPLRGTQQFYRLSQ
jgi:uncharacterized repeat protein (TIGR03803 family)